MTSLFILCGHLKKGSRTRWRKVDGAGVSRRSQLKNRGRTRSGELGWTSDGASSNTAGGGVGHASSHTTRGDIGRVISGCEHGGQEGNNEMRITYVGMRRRFCEKTFR